MQLGLRGATQQSWQRTESSRVYIRELQQKHPRANQRRITDLLVELMRDDDDAAYAIADYAVRAAYAAQEGYERRANGNGTETPQPKTKAHTRKPTPQERERQQAEFDKAVRDGVAQILLLNQEMPNGKRLRYCTGEEVGKFGAGYTKIAKEVGKTKMVGSVLSEAQVRALMG